MRGPIDELFMTFLCARKKMGRSHAKNPDAWKVSVPLLYDMKPGDGCERTAPDHYQDGKD